MPFDATPQTTRDRADYIAGTTVYPVRVQSLANGGDVTLHRDRAGVLTELSGTQFSVAEANGAISVTLVDLAPWAANDQLVVTRSSAATDTASHTGAAATSFARVFALVRELIAADVGAAPAVDQVQLRAAIDVALAALTPKWTEALQTRLLATMSANEVRSAIDAALDDLPTDIRAAVTGDWVVALLDTATGSADWRTPQQPNVAVDPDQMSGTGTATSPLTIITDGITVGLIAANAVASRNLQDQAVTIDKLSAALQARWRELANAVTGITTTAGTATATRADGTTFTFDVGQGSGGGGGGAALMQVRLPATPAKTLAGVADAWSSWEELVHSRGLTAEEAGVVGLKGAVVGNITSDATTGGQRVWVQSRIMRKRGSVETDLGHSIPYVRNLGSGVTQDTEDTSQLFEAPVSMDDDPAMAGDEYHLDARIWCQAAAMTVAFKESTEAAPAGTKLQVKTYGASGGGGGTLEVFDVDPQSQVRSVGRATEILFRDANVSVANGRADVDPRFPAQVQSDWAEADAASAAFVKNKPGRFVDTYASARPTELEADRLYAWAGAPDKYGGPGLYQAVANADTPLNLVAGKFLDTAAYRTGNAIQALPTSPSNHWLLSWGMRLDRATRQVSLWVRDDAPAAATLYAQFRTQGSDGVWSDWSAAYPLSGAAIGASSRLTAPANSRHYGGQLATPAIPEDWTGGWGRLTQVRVWTDRLSTAPYALKLAHVVRWLEDPADALQYLQGLTGDHRMSSHVLKDGALARVVTVTPTTAQLEAGYAEGELVFDLSTSPPALKVVQATRDQPHANANRFTVATDGQGNGVAAQGDFDPNPGTNYFQIHAAPGGGTGSDPGRVTLYLDTPGDTPPATFIGRPVTGGFPVLTFTRIAGALASITVGSRQYQGYQADFVDTNLHRFADATFSYDLYTRYVGPGDNDPMNVDTGTVHVPASLVDVGGTGGGTRIPAGGWRLSDLSAEAKAAAGVTVDASRFSGQLGTGDTNVQTALESLDGGTLGRPVRMLAADQPDAAGQVPLWTAAGKWIASKISGAADAISVSDTLGLGLVGKLLEIYNAFAGGMWSNVAGAAATAPAVATAPLGVRPVGILGTWAFALYQANVSPAWPQTEGGDTWVVVRSPSDTEYMEERYRLVVVESDGTTVVSSHNLDGDDASLIGSSGGYHYYRVELDRIGAGEGYRVQQLTPFEPVRSRLDLVTAMLRDFVPEAVKTLANDRRVVVWDWAARGFRLGTPERPAPVAALPEPMVVGRRYITTGPSQLQPVISITPAASGANIVATATFKIGTEDWELIRFGPGGPAAYRNQTVLRAPAGSSLGLTSGGTPPFLAIHYGGGEGTLGNVGTDARSMIVGSAPAYNAGTAYELYLRHSVDPHENVPPAVDVPSGDWTATGTHAVQGTPGAQYDWATRGNEDPVPAGKIPHLAGQEVLRHAFRMPLTTTSASNRFSAPALLDASVDLNDSALDGAELIVTLDVSIQGSGSNDLLSWEEGEDSPTAEDKRFHYSTRVGVETLRRLADYVAKTAGAPTGFMELLELSGWRDTTRQGRLFLGVVVEQDVNAAGTGSGTLDRPGPFVYWTGVAGAVGGVVAGTVTAHLSRIAGGSASTFTGFPDTPGSYTGQKGKVVEVNEAETALVFGDKGAGGEPGGKGDEIARYAVPAGVHAAGTLIDGTWTVTAAGTADGWNRQNGPSGTNNQLNAPLNGLPEGQNGYVVEVFVGATAGRRSDILSGALSSLEEGTSGRSNSGGNYSLYYKISLTTPGGTAGTRAVNLEFQRQLTERHADAMRFYGAAQSAILEGTVIVVSKLLTGVPGIGGVALNSSLTEAQFQALTPAQLRAAPGLYITT